MITNNSKTKSVSKRARKLFFALSIIFLIVLAVNGCSVTVEPEASSSISNETTVTFSRIQKEIFTVSCALSGCHTGANAAAGLDLSSGKAYSNLVNVQSAFDANILRVVPGNSANSFLIKRLRNTGESPSIMPPQGKLNEAAIQLVETWITNGAIND